MVNSRSIDNDFLIHFPHVYSHLKIRLFGEPLIPAGPFRCGKPNIIMANELWHKLGDLEDAYVFTDAGT